MQKWLRSGCVRVAESEKHLIKIMKSI
eukprot:SAG31_NODE_34803_length_329_cov_0.673913_1_plen_26_part_10